MCVGDQAYIGLRLLGVTNADVVAGLQHAQQFGLQLRREFTDLTEEKRSALRRFDKCFLAFTAPVNAPAT